MSPTKLHPASVLEAVQAVNDWIAPARVLFDQGRGEAVQLVMSPGDMTNYTMIFSPAPKTVFVTNGEFVRTDATLALLGYRAIVINPIGSPDATYVREKLETRSHATVAAVGVTWALMVTNDPDLVARMYESVAAEILRWDLTNFGVKADG